MLKIYGVAVKMLEDMSPALGAIEMRDRDLARAWRYADVRADGLREVIGTLVHLTR